MGKLYRFPLHRLQSGIATLCKFSRGNLCLHVETENGKLYYELSRNGKPILDKSHLGFILKEDTLAGHLEITEALHHSFSGTWEQIWGRRPDCGKQLS